MVDYNYLTPIVSFALNQKIILFGGRAISRRNLFIQIFQNYGQFLNGITYRTTLVLIQRKLKKFQIEKLEGCFINHLGCIKKHHLQGLIKKLFFLKMSGLKTSLFQLMKNL